MRSLYNADAKGPAMRADGHDHDHRRATWRRRARLGWAACAAAAVLALAIGLWRDPPWLHRADDPHPPTWAHLARGGPADRIERPADGPARPGPGTPRPVVGPGEPDDPTKALDLLDGKFEEAKGAPKASRRALAEVLARADDIATGRPGSAEAARALALASRCHTELADRRKAQEAFLAYADARGGRARANALARGLAEPEAARHAEITAARVILGEAARRFTQGDRIAALSYCDVAMTRYPGKPPAWQAQVLVAEHYLKLGDDARGAELLEAVVRQAPQTKAAMLARMSLPSALFNAGRREEAARAWIDYARACKSRNGQANGYYNAATMLVACGKRHCPSAIGILKMVAEKYPESPFARRAKRKLGSIHKAIEDEILDM